MEVTYRNFSFNTNDMRAFSTGVVSMPTIYVNQNGLCFLARTRHSWTTTKVSHISHMEVVRYAKTYGMEELKSYLSEVRKSQGALVR